MSALIYIPAENPEAMGWGKCQCQVSLYCKKVLIDPEPKNLFSEWMRFVKGVVDSSDIPLNISRESMQDSGLTAKIGRLVQKKFIKHLAETLKNDPKKYDEFFKKFGKFIKEGASIDFENKGELAKLLRFESSLFQKGQYVSLEDYIGRIKPDQKSIYCAFGPDRNAIESAPYIEAFKARGIEVLYLFEPIDTFMIGNIGEYDGKRFENIDSAEIKHFLFERQVYNKSLFFF